MLGYIKENTKELCGSMPLHYPADRVGLFGNNNNDVEKALTYSANEHVVGKWIDGSILYEKTLDTGALPNTSSKEIAHNVANINEIISITGMAYNSAKVVQVPLPLIGNNNSENIIVYVANIQTGITIVTGMDRSVFNSGYLTIRYTKRT